VLMVVAGVLVWANLRIRDNVAKSVGGIDLHGRISHADIDAAGFGWPLPYSIAWSERNPFTTGYILGYPMALVGDVLICLAILVATGAGFEYFLRQRRKTARTVSLYFHLSSA